MTAIGPAVRLGVVDSDRGFREVLTKRLNALRWPFRAMESAVPLDALRAMRLDVVVIDFVQSSA